jgi:hypothetical protein
MAAVWEPAKILVEMDAERLGTERHENNARAKIDSPEQKPGHVR